MWTIFLVHIIGLISPGPDFFYVCRKAMSDSRRSAVLSSIGITFGVGFWALVVVFGLAFLNKTVPTFQFYLMIAGGSYLAYNGFKMLQITKNAKIDEKVQKSESKSGWREILAGLMINLSNPKVVIFFSSVLAGYMSKITAMSDIVMLLAILMSSTFVWFAIVAVLFSQKKIRRFYANYNRYLDNAAGAVFMLFGSSLIYEGIATLLF